MTIIVFLIDTSASMNQRTYIGPSFLDLAKGAVDTFLKYRARDPSARGADRYMLLTFEEPPKNIKAGWRESQMVFMQELKNLKATSITTVGAALSNVLHLLNVNRLQSGIDNFGCGRFPHWLEPAAIVLITDGGCMVQPNGVAKHTIEITPSQLPGSELVSEPFRWDQRIFALVLRLSGHPPKGGAPIGLVPQDGSPLDAICEATGGRSYSIKTQKMINQCLESLVQKIQSGVVVTFEKHGPEPPLAPVSSEDRGKCVPLENGFIHQISKLGNTNNHVATSPGSGAADIVSTGGMETKSSSRPSSPSPPPAEPVWAKTRRMIYVSRGAGSRGYNPSHWTIPEAFWPDHSVSVLPPRSAHPVIKFKCEPQEPVFPPDLPFDKYELEPSPLTQFILERKQPSICWFCYVMSSNGKSGDLGAPFGYLKASTSLTSVTLTVLPYNFPVLIPLVEEIKLARGKASQQWKAKFDRYLRGLPPYYTVALKAAFSKLNLLHLMTDVPDKHLSVNVQAHLGKVKLRAREEMERLNQSIVQPLSAPEGIRVVPRSAAAPNSTLRRPGDNEFGAFRIHLEPVGGAVPRSLANHSQMSFRNPFDIQRDQLLVQIAKMRVNLKQSLSTGTSFQLLGAKHGMKYRLQDVEELHHLPIGVMGNYQDYLRLMPAPLRELDPTPVRLHAFGNPFKVDKRMLVDEADIDNLVGTATAAGTGSNQSASGAKIHSKRIPAINASSANVENPAARGNQSTGSHVAQSRKRKPGPLPKDFRYRKKRKRDDDDGSLSSDDQFSVSGPSSPASSDISYASGDSDIGDSESVASDVSSMDATDRIHETEASSSLMIDESNESGINPDPNAIRPNLSTEQAPSSLAQAFLPKVEASTSSTGVKRPAVNGLEANKKVPKPTWTADQWLEARRGISALIRTPSQGYGALFDLLDGLPKLLSQGLYAWALEEAGRFRRADLCQRLQKKISEFNKTLNQKQTRPHR